jgi:hypothetical protein
MQNHFTARLIDARKPHPALLDLIESSCWVVLSEQDFAARQGVSPGLNVLR